ncbi:hypothetical protein HFD88_004746 [Aspergillus terreus]|nr:hypothetical protein HFD88_004746 [Aspergillus terreus]
MHAITILGYRKDGMSEDEYHTYISNVHAVQLKELLARNDIVSYTMQHNTTQSKHDLVDTIYGGQISDDKVAGCDAVIQIVFKDMHDYLRVRQDPYFQNVINPDHANFADSAKTTFVMGWFERHVTDGVVVSNG